MSEWNDTSESGQEREVLEDIQRQLKEANAIDPVEALEAALAIREREGYYGSTMPVEDLKEEKPYLFRTTDK